MKLVGNNLPPGVSGNDIPGNKKEDEEWDRFIELIRRDIDEHYFTLLKAYTIWKIGISAMELLKAEKEFEKEEGI